MTTLIKTLPGVFAAADGALRIEDLPFPRAGIVRWLDWTDADVTQGSSGGNPYAASLIDRITAQTVPRTNDAGSPMFLELENGIPVGRYRSDVGSLPTKLGYNLGAALIQNKAVVTFAGVHKPGTPGVTSENLVGSLCHGSTNFLLKVVSNNNTVNPTPSMSAGARHSATGDTPYEAIMPIEAGKWIPWIAEFDYAGKSISIEYVGKQRVTVVAFAGSNGNSGAPANQGLGYFARIDASPTESESATGRYTGKAGPLIFADARVSGTQLTMLRDFLASRARRLNAVQA